MQQAEKITRKIAKLDLRQHAFSMLRCCCSTTDGRVNSAVTSRRKHTGLRHVERQLLPRNTNCGLSINVIRNVLRNNRNQLIFQKGFLSCASDLHTHVTGIVKLNGCSCEFACCAVRKLHMHNRTVRGGNLFLTWFRLNAIYSPLQHIGHIDLIFTKQPVRQKSKGKRSQEELDSESSDEESEWMEEGLEEGGVQALSGAPDNFSQVKVHLKGLRVDAVVSAGLNVARNKVDDVFYKSKLLLNGKKVLKKGVKMEVGDYVDVVSGTEDEQVMVKRVQLAKILKERTKSGKLNVWLRVWKTDFPAPNSD